MPPASTASTESQLMLLIQRTDFLQQEVESNKREAEIDLKRVKDDADAEIRRVREKADADDKANKASIAALVAERNNLMLWGLLVLGTAVTTMAAFIFKNLPKFMGGGS